MNLALLLMGNLEGAILQHNEFVFNNKADARNLLLLVAALVVGAWCSQWWRSGGSSCVAGVVEQDAGLLHVAGIRSGGR